MTSCTRKLASPISAQKLMLWLTSIYDLACVGTGQSDIGLGLALSRVPAVSVCSIARPGCGRLHVRAKSVLITLDKPVVRRRQHLPRVIARCKAWTGRSVRHAASRTAHRRAIKNTYKQCSIADTRCSPGVHCSPVADLMRWFT